jgi:hypothetical protein
MTYQNGEKGFLGAAWQALTGTGGDYGGSSFIHNNGGDPYNVNVHGNIDYSNGHGNPNNNDIHGNSGNTDIHGNSTWNPPSQSKD